MYEPGPPYVLPCTADPQGTLANLGMYATGIPMGMLIDARGPRVAVVIGALALGIGYYPIHRGTSLIAAIGPLY